jgi:hypothetical protein
VPKKSLILSRKDKKVKVHFSGLSEKFTISIDPQSAFLKKRENATFSAKKQG